jgi:hypothetical protein
MIVEELAALPCDHGPCFSAGRSRASRSKPREPVVFTFRQPTRKKKFHDIDERPKRTDEKSTASFAPGFREHLAARCLRKMRGHERRWRPFSTPETREMALTDTVLLGPRSRVADFLEKRVKEAGTFGCLATHGELRSF